MCTPRGISAARITPEEWSRIHSFILFRSFAVFTSGALQSFQVPRTETFGNTAGPVFVWNLGLHCHLFHSKFSSCTSGQQKAQPPTEWHHWPLWTLHLLSLFTHPHLQSQSLDRQPTNWPTFLSLWEHDFITEMNCLIVRTQLPPLAEEGGAILDTGASCGDLASGVISLTVWKASHVTHHWMAAPPPSQLRALTQPHQAPACSTSWSIFGQYPWIYLFFFFSNLGSSTYTRWKEFECSFIYRLRLNLMSLMVFRLKTNSWPWSQLCGKEDNFFLRHVHCQALPALSTMCGKSILFAKKAEDRQNFRGKNLGGQF